MSRTDPVLAFLFTDIEGSTRRWETHPDAMRDAAVANALELAGRLLFPARR